MRILIYWAVLVCTLPFTTAAQINSSVWSSPAVKPNTREGSMIQLREHVFISLNFEHFKQNLSSSRNEEVKISLPTPDGNFISFVLNPMEVFAPALQTKFFNFRSYYGYAETDKRKKIGISITPFGLTAFVLGTGEDSYYIDPASPDNNQDYLVYYKHQLQQTTPKKFFCKELPPMEPEVLDDPTNHKNQDNSIRAGDCQLRTYRLALACTGEYGTFHGGTIEKVMNAFQVAVTRINVVYRKEIGITMQLVDDVDKLIFFNPSTDPYTNSNTSAMLSQNQSTVDDIIGRPNYDIGHVFGTGDGGIASLGSVCSNNRKAQGVTGRPSPMGDAFFIDYVAHEMGHQFRANHTQNNSCQRYNSTAVEPGSASTIMGYAGICSPNVQNNSHDYFHTISLSEISSFILSQPGCGTIENLDNSRPKLTVDKTNFTIPIQTPFYLAASGQDDDGDLITYSWEQMNNEAASMPPKANNISGPMFRSIPPSTSPIRYFPDLKNKYGQWEVLPSLSRTLNFRATLRDNSENGGCTTEQNVIVKTDSNMGPFTVTQPNAPGVIWLAGNEATVTWNVANTDQSPVNCQFVDIWLSIDGGTSYPILLAQNLPNEGQAVIKAPNLSTTTARAMVVASDNIFFDVSNFSFEIKSSFQIELNTNEVEACLEKATFPFLLTPQGNAQNHEITFTLIEKPLGFDVIFPDTIRQLPKMDSILVTTSNQSPGLYNIVYEIQDGPYKVSDTLVIKILNQDDFPLLTSPAPGTHFQSGSNIFLTWSESLSKYYELQISADPGFQENETSVYNLTEEKFSFTGISGPYFWRVRSISTCFTAPWSPVSVFYTGPKQNYENPLLRNNALVVEAGQGSPLSSSHLKIDYEEVNAFSYQVVRIPSQGNLILANGINQDTLVAGSEFTTEDIINGRILYQHENGQELRDSFIFLIENEGFWEAPFTFQIHILQPGKLQVFMEIFKDISCFGEQGGLIISSKNAIHPLRYREVQSTEFIELTGDTLWLPADTYQWVVMDATGDSTLTNPVKMTSPDSLENHTTQVFYDLMVQSNGGAGMTRNFSLDNSNFTQDSLWKDVLPGEYTTYVQDVNGCIATDTILMSVEPLSLFTIEGTDTLPCPDDTTLITLELGGGFPPYHLELNDSIIQGSVILLGAGNFAIRIYDAGGKFIDTILSIFAGQPLELQLDKDRSDVFWTVIGGSPPYEYSFDGSQFFTDEFALDLANGQYILYVRDANNCTTNIAFDINLLQSVGVDITHPLCYGEAGTATITPENGTYPILVGLDKNQLDSVYTIDGLLAGDYTLFITDGLGDSIEQQFTVLQPDSLTVLFEIKQDTVIVLASGGTPPYMYSVDQGINYFAFNVFYNVPTGKHGVLIKDANDCISSGEFEIISSVHNPTLQDVIRIYPNPVQDDLRIDFGNIVTPVLKIQVFDSQGMSLAISDVSTAENQNVYPVDQLSGGIYLLAITTKQKTYYLRFVKI